ncbi:13300_t:CDS:2 [Entrophospora sp. SA101]|nr:13300_t:CDS:2 [Entrophospora sp. SA101]
MKFCAEKESKASFGAKIRTATILDFMMILTVDDVEYELVFLESSRLIGSTSPEKIRDGNFKLLRVVNDGMPEMQAKKGSVCIIAIQVQSYKELCSVLRNKVLGIKCWN